MRVAIHGAGARNPQTKKERRVELSGPLVVPVLLAF